MNINFPIINPVTVATQALTSWYKHNCTWVIHHPHNRTLSTSYKSYILSVHNKSSYLFLFYLEFNSTPRCGSDLVLNANLLQVQHADMLYNMGGGRQTFRQVITLNCEPQLSSMGIWSKCILHTGGSLPTPVITLVIKWNYNLREEKRSNPIHCFCRM